MGFAANTDVQIILWDFQLLTTNRPPWWNLCLWEDPERTHISREVPSPECQTARISWRKTWSSVSQTDLLDQVDVDMADVDMTDDRLTEVDAGARENFSGALHMAPTHLHREVEGPNMSLLCLLATRVEDRMLHKYGFLNDNIVRAYYLKNPLKCGNVR